MPKEIQQQLDVFLKPGSVAVIGASEKPGSWGAFIMEGLQRKEYGGKIYPVNPRTESVYGIKTFSDIKTIPHPVDLAVIATPEHTAEEIIQACGEKGAKGIVMITAGFGEAVEGGRDRELALAALARSFGMRILGPNVSGTFNLHANFNASPAGDIFTSKLAAVCQGGYAFYDILVSAGTHNMGVGKFIHTGNECDLQVVDFIDYYGYNAEVKGIVMYLETIRDGKRFKEVAGRVAKEKPIVVHKVGRTRSGARAASSHTGALAGTHSVYDGLFHQLNIIPSPTLELLLPLAHALIEHPPMKDNRVAIITMGGSWGVVLTDSLEEKGLRVPELSKTLQKKLRDLGMPLRASTKNPVDIGAAGVGSFSPETLSEMGRLILTSGEMDALIVHGLGRPGRFEGEVAEHMKFFIEIEKKILKNITALEKETGRPVMVGSLFTSWESQTVHDLNREGIRFYNSIEDLSQVLSGMLRYWKGKR